MDISMLVSTQHLTSIDDTNSLNTKSPLCEEAKKLFHNQNIISSRPNHNRSYSASDVSQFPSGSSIKMSNDLYMAAQILQDVSAHKRSNSDSSTICKRGHFSLSFKSNNLDTIQNDCDLSDDLSNPDLDNTINTDFLDTVYSVNLSTSPSMRGVELLAAVAERSKPIEYSEPKLIISKIATTKSIVKVQEKPSKVHALLEDLYLWKQFHELGNEMIITRSGRCLFPTLRIQLFDMEPTALYMISLQICAVSQNKFQYKGQKWVPRSTSHPVKCRNSQKRFKTIYCHSNPRTGHYFMNFGASFSKVKLTNDSFHSSDPLFSSSSSRKGNLESSISLDDDSNLLIPLSTFKKYRCVILVQKTTSSGETIESTYIPLKETSFIAITHYQNDKVNTLKKLNNPHAKGFVHKMISGWKENVCMGKNLDLLNYLKRGEYNKIIQTHCMNQTPDCEKKNGQQLLRRTSLMRRTKVKRRIVCPNESSSGEEEPFLKEIENWKAEDETQCEEESDDEDSDYSHNTRKHEILENPGKRKLSFHYHPNTVFGRSSLSLSKGKKVNSRNVPESESEFNSNRRKRVVKA